MSVPDRLIGEPSDTFPPDRIRNQAIWVKAGKGSGKSRTLGRAIVKQDVLRGIAGVVIDPVGGVIDNFLDSMLRMSAVDQAKIWPRVIYVDVGNTQAVVPMPLYYRLSEDETPFAVSQRFMDAVRLLDPNLQSAAVEGWNALWQAGTYTGMALAKFGGQITDAPAMLANPAIWEQQLKSLAKSQPEFSEVVNWLYNPAFKKQPELRMRRTASFLQKIAIFSLEPHMRAMFGAGYPEISWQKVVDQGLTVLFDLRHVQDVERQQFLLLWIMSYFLSFVKYRGAGRHTPIALTIDELSVLSNLDRRSGFDLFATMIDELLNVWSRQGQVWVILAHQENWQVSPRMLKTLMSCGTRIMGRTSDWESALELAHELMPIDPRMVKHYEPVFDGQRNVVHNRAVFYTLEELQYMAASMYMNLGRFQFLMRSVSEEGGQSTKPRLLDMSGIEPGIYPNDAVLNRIRAKLHLRTAIPVHRILETIQRRQSSWEEKARGFEEPTSGKPNATKQQVNDRSVFDIVQNEVQFDPDGFKVE